MSRQPRGSRGSRRSQHSRRQQLRRPQQGERTHAFRTYVWRGVTRNIARFVALFCIVAIGAGVYAGLRMFVPDMYASADAFFDKYNLADVQVSSSLGLTDGDLAAIRETSGVRGAAGMRDFEVSATRGSGGSDVLEIEISARDMAAYTSSLDASSGLEGDPSAVSRPILKEGRLPQAANEIAVSTAGDGFGAEVSIGDVLSVTRVVGLDNISDVLAQDTFTVVGIVQSPEWLGTALSVSPTTGASLTNFAYVDLSATSDPTTYTTVAITCDDAYAKTAFTDAYDEAVAPVIASLKDVAQTRVQARYDELLDRANSAVERAEAAQRGEGGVVSRLLAGTGAASQALAQSAEQARQARDTLVETGVQPWYVVGRDASPSCYLYKATALRMGRICSIFPAFFFVVAALVSLTTLARMVDADRVEIGTLKALGYSRQKIAGKYLVFSSLASVGGSIAGIAVGVFTLPIAIWTPYSRMYIDFPFYMGIHQPDCAIAFVVSVALCLGMTLIAVRRSLREPACALLVPAVPKSGRHILLERVRPLWRRLPFSLKVCARNVFRYKARMVMTIVGVAGCCGLMLVGLGVQDKLDGFVQAQYGGIYTYDVVVNFDAASDEGDDEGERGDPDPTSTQADPDPTSAQVDPDPTLTSTLNNELGAGSWSYFCRQAAIASNPDGDPSQIPYGIGGDLDRTGGSVQAALRDGRSDRAGNEDEGIERDVGVVVPQDLDQEFIRIRDYQTGERLELPASGAIITERLAEQLMVGIGDTIQVSFDASGKQYAVQVAGIMRNFVGHYLYMSPSAYEEAFGEAPAYNLVLGANPRQIDIDALREELTHVDARVQAVGVPSDESGRYEDVSQSLNSIVAIILGVSGALAFIVVYALTEINIEERRREIATLKVLGFERREVRGYVYRETYALAAVGILLGLPFGAWLCNVVMRAAEFDNVIYFRTTHADCYLWAALLTAAVVLIVTFAMRRRLAGIDMTSSLAAAE